MIDPIQKLLKEVRRRHHKTRKVAKKKYKKQKRVRKQQERRTKIEVEIQNIKKSNLVKNFSNEEVPDEAYLYLALGSTFCPTSKPRKHDYLYDAKEFCRKLAWSTYYENRRKESENTRTEELTHDVETLLMDTSDSEEDDAEAMCSFGIPQKLKIKSRRLPEYSDNLLSFVTQKIKDGISKITLPKVQKRNLTILEAKGQK